MWQGHVITTANCLRQTNISVQLTLDKPNTYTRKSIRMHIHENFYNRCKCPCYWFTFLKNLKPTNKHDTIKTSFFLSRFLGARAARTSLWICIASSRVGAMTSPMGPSSFPIGGWSRTCRIIGNTWGETMKQNTIRRMDYVPMQRKQRTTYWDFKTFLDHRFEENG